jgi:hypothetical protein
MNAYSPDDSQVTVGVINRDVRAVVKEERHLLKAEIYSIRWQRTTVYSPLIRLRIR